MTTPNKEQIEEMLTPRCEFHASTSLKRNILDAATRQAATQEEPHSSTSRRKSRIRLMHLLPTGIAATVAFIVAILLTLPNNSIAHDASAALSAAAEIFNKSPAFSATINVRTNEGYLFSRIGLKCNFLEHTLIVQPGTGYWLLTKPTRTIVGDGIYTWQWIHNYPHGYKYDVSRNEENIEYFTLLLTPGTLLHNELEFAKNNPKTVTEYIEKDSIITLTIQHSATPINIDNERSMGYPVVGRKSRLYGKYISEFDTKREYTFDQRSGQLLTMKITDRESGKTIMELTDINYNVKVTQETFATPSHITWADMTEVGMKQKANRITRTDFVCNQDTAIYKIFEALHNWDIELLKTAFAEPNADVIERLYGKYRGCSLISKSEYGIIHGTIAVTFHPCNILLADGTKIRRDIVLRKDNPLKAYIIDGGL